MIDNRLKSLVKYIDFDNRIIDIGCDHALLDIYLIKNNITDKIIVSDISENALNQGIKNIKKYGFETKIDARLGDGLNVLNEKDNINTIVISGMGASTILSILNNNYIKKIDKLIIQSNNDHYLLRKYLTSNNYYISDEEALIVNKKMYINIVFKKGIKKYKEQELKYGIDKMVNKDLYYNSIIMKDEEILKKVQNKELLNEVIYLKDKIS